MYPTNKRIITCAPNQRVMMVGAAIQDVILRVTKKAVSAVTAQHIFNAGKQIITFCCPTQRANGGTSGKINRQIPTTCVGGSEMHPVRTTSATEKRIITSITAERVILSPAIQRVIAIAAR